MTSPALPTARERRGRQSAVQALVILLLVQVSVYAVSTVPGVRPRGGFVVALDGWLQGSAYVTAALVALLTVPRRGFFTHGCFGAALTARAIGFVVFLTVVRHLDPVPVPSVVDLFWLLSYLLLAVGLVRLARRGVIGLPLSVVLDGVVAALATAAVSVVLLEALAREVASDGAARRAHLVDLAYPALDVLLLLMVVGVFTTHRWRPPRIIWLLGAGIAGFAVADACYVVSLVTGGFRPGSALSTLSLLSATAVAAACLPGLDLPRTAPRAQEPGLVLPFMFALASLGLLVHASSIDEPLTPPAVVLATLAVTVAIGRTALSFRIVRALAEHRREARTDELTGVANRRAFNEALAVALRGRAPHRVMALLVIDLDDFKSVNDTLGHHHGDELLVLVAQRFQHALRGGDLLARIGGDEFAVLLDGADAELAASVAERLRSGLDRPIVVGGHTLDVAASIGIAVFPGDGRQLAELFQHADIAMYEAKSARSGQSRFLPQHGVRVRATREGAERLSRAVNDELVVLYQPQVALETGEVVGVEALVRWQRPARQPAQQPEHEPPLLLPAEFLHEVERAGLIRRLTSTVLERAVHQGAAWHRAGFPITLSVNLSVTDLLDGRFPGQVATLLDRSGLPGRVLAMELTENLFMTDPDRALMVIRRLLDLEVTVVLDDYGTGYSSLGYLRDLPEIRGLKLDRSFVSSIDEDPRAAAIVESTITLARTLGLKVVAEGVETAAVRDRLAELGCGLAQGYLFARPLAAEQVRFGVLAAARAHVG